MDCPKCNEKKEMKIVFFRYENGECFADGIRRFLCHDCGYQVLAEEKEEKYMIKPIEIELDVPYYMPLKVYNEFKKRVKQEKKFIVTAIKGAHERGEGIVFNIKLVMEW